MIEVEQKVYTAYQPIFEDEASPSTAQGALEETAQIATPEMALPERHLVPSLEHQLGDSLVHYFAPEAPESLNEYRLAIPPVDDIDLVPTPPKPIVIEEEVPESARPSVAELVFLNEDEPALTREEMIAREAEARLAVIQNISMVDADAEDETPAYTPIFLSQALDHELVKLESTDESIDTPPES